MNKRQRKKAMKQIITAFFSATKAIASVDWETRLCNYLDDLADRIKESQNRSIQD